MSEFYLDDNDSYVVPIIVIGLITGGIMWLLTGQWVVGLLVAVAVPLVILGYFIAAIIIGGLFILPLKAIKYLRKRL